MLEASNTSQTFVMNASRPCFRLAARAILGDSVPNRSSGPFRPHLDEKREICSQPQIGLEVAFHLRYSAVVISKL